MNADYLKLIKIRSELKENKGNADELAKRLRRAVNPEVPLILCDNLKGVMIQIENMVSILINESDT